MSETQPLPQLPDLDPEGPRTPLKEYYYQNREQLARLMIEKARKGDFSAIDPKNPAVPYGLASDFYNWMYYPTTRPSYTEQQTLCNELLAALEESGNMKNEHAQKLINNINTVLDRLATVDQDTARLAAMDQDTAQQAQPSLIERFRTMLGLTRQN